MSALLGDVATHVLRQHRDLRRRLSDLRLLAQDSPENDPRKLDSVARRLARAAQAAVRRATRSDALLLRDDLGLRLNLRPAVSSARVTLMVGRLTSAELETVLASADVGITLTPGGDDGEWTVLEVNHALTPRRRLPGDAPAHHLTEMAIHAIVGELASSG